MLGLDVVEARGRQVRLGQKRVRHRASRREVPRDRKDLQDRDSAIDHEPDELNLRVVAVDASS